MTQQNSEAQEFQTRINRASTTWLSWLIVLFLATQAYPQSAGPEFPNPGNAHMSHEKQRQLGLQAAAHVYQTMPVLPDNSPETQYIRQLGEKLVATIPRNTHGRLNSMSWRKKRSMHLHCRADQCSSTLGPSRPPRMKPSLSV
jgi:hypothetical protein